MCFAVAPAWHKIYVMYIEKILEYPGCLGQKFARSFREEMSRAPTTYVFRLFHSYAVPIFFMEMIFDLQFREFRSLCDKNP
jgi:hypothetical protein